MRSKYRYADALYIEKRETDNPFPFAVTPAIASRPKYETDHYKPVVNFSAFSLQF